MARYGLKIWVTADLETSYAWRCEIYLGKTGGTAEELLRKKIALVGTIRKSKPELPPELVQAKRQGVFSSVFAFMRNTTAVSYIPRRGRNVTLISTRYREAAVTEGPKKKPEINTDYNRCKGAVDNLNKVVSTYTCKRKTNRWPQALFFNMLDNLAYNGYVIFVAVDPFWNQRKLFRRRLSLEELGNSLVSAAISSTEIEKWLKLCDELLEEVFVETVLMEGDKAIGKIALVSKRFKDIVSTERFWKRAHYRWLNIESNADVGDGLRVRPSSVQGGVNLEKFSSAFQEELKHMYAIECCNACGSLYKSFPGDILDKGREERHEDSTVSHLTQVTAAKSALQQRNQMIKTEVHSPGQASPNWNCDKTGFGDKPKSKEKVMCQQGKRHVYRQHVREDKTTERCLFQYKAGDHCQALKDAAHAATNFIVRSAAQQFINAQI
ncbi:hypothetical protein ABVT39_006063 [Epinephelus coioides]